MVLMNIVQVNAPALLGLDAFYTEQFNMDNVTNRLVHRNVLSPSSDKFDYIDQLSVPIILHSNHFYSRMNFPLPTLYSTTQLLKLH